MQTRDRITINMNILDAVMAVSEGNPGAARVLMEAYNAAPTVDPDDFLGGLGALLAFDSHRFYGSKAWMLYKDLCGQNIVKTLGTLRAIQLGIVDQRLVHKAIGDDRTPGDRTALDGHGGVDGLLAKVKEQLPKFASAVPA